MTDEDIRRHISLMRSIERETIHLPIATVERLMATGHKIKVGKATVKDGKVKPVVKQSVSRKIGAKKKADRIEKSLRVNASKRKGAT